MELNNQQTILLQRSCAYLFTINHAQNQNFIESLSPERLKKAFRKKVFQYHPDRYPDETSEMIKKRQERFGKITTSYKILTQFLAEKDEKPVKKISVSKKIIAIGGAKGGIGKSIISTNLAVLLSRLKKKTVAADLDLYGPNLHLYFNKINFKYSINDFIYGNLDNLAPAITKTPFGPYLIAGDNSKLGIANITYAQKMKIMGAVRKIKSHYTILDLGGDTTFNTLDFFINADHRIIVTTCDPAAYLEAINFIKASLYRGLNRLSSSGSSDKSPKDKKLEHLIHEVINLGKKNGDKRIKILVQRVQNELPGSWPLLRNFIKNFRLNLIINMVDDSRFADKLATHIKKLVSKTLLLNLTHLGNITFHPDVKKSSRTLIPAIHHKPSGKPARELKNIFNKLIKTAH